MAQLIVLSTLCFTFSLSAPETIRFWKGKAPGSEEWNWEETTSSFPGGGLIVRNVVEPTLTVYLPNRANANRAAVKEKDFFEMPESASIKA